MGLLRGARALVPTRDPPRPTEHSPLLVWHLPAIPRKLVQLCAHTSRALPFRRSRSSRPAHHGRREPRRRFHDGDGCALRQDRKGASDRRDGAPGGGKSTTVDGLAAALRKRQESVAVIAVDPSSPFTGGALLGDRIRMRTAEEDTEVFVRSMATRGSLGGLARATVDAADLLDAFGFGRILVETVGVGQAEHDVVSATDTVVVVLYPGWRLGAGDEGGLDGDRRRLRCQQSGSARRRPAHRRHRANVGIAARARGWKPPVARVVATERKGIGELVAAIESHKSARERSGELEARRGARRLEQVRRDVEEGLREVIFGGGVARLHRRRDRGEAPADGDRRGSHG